MVEIAPFAERHIDQAIELWSKTENLGLGDSDTPEEIRKFISRNAGFCFVAAEEGLLTGTILAGHDARRGYIHHLAIRNDRRREGIASALLEASLTSLEAEGILKCHAFVFRSNPYADTFWSQIGWTRRDDLHVFSMHLSDRAS